MAKILVVDDEPDMIWAITNVLLTENHSVVSVSSGEEALVKVKENIDLVLLDFRLPGMDGIQILEKIKQMKPELPVIMVTGYGGIEEAVQSIKLGASHYLSKPFDNAHLIETVNKSLRLDLLKKESLFGKRLAEKLEPKAPGQEKPASPVARKGPGGNRWIKPVLAALLFAVLAAGAAMVAWKKMGGGEAEYLIPNSHVSGLSWGQNHLWVSDWFIQSIQQYDFADGQVNLSKTFILPGYHFTGIAWVEGVIFTCDSWKKTISKHNMDEKLSVAAGYPSPGPNPSGLFYDGKYLWSCDGDTRKIYQHALDQNLTVLATYDTPALFPVGLYHDKTNFWVASAVGMKIFRHLINERFRLDKTYAFPDVSNLGKPISAFTFKDGEIWMACEGVNKVFRKDLKSLQETNQ